MSPEQAIALKTELGNVWSRAALESERLIDRYVDGPKPRHDRRIKVTRDGGRTCYESVGGLGLTGSQRSGGDAHMDRRGQWLAFHQWASDYKSSDVVLLNTVTGEEKYLGRSGQNQEFSWDSDTVSSGYWWLEGNYLIHKMATGLELSRTELDPLLSWTMGFSSGQPVQWVYGTSGADEYLQFFDGSSGRLYDKWRVQDATNGQTKRLKGAFLYDGDKLLTSPASNPNEIYSVGIDGTGWKRVSPASNGRGAPWIHPIPSSDSDVIVYADSANFPGGQNGIVVDADEGVLAQWTQSKLRALITPGFQGAEGYISVSHFSVRGTKALASFTIGINHRERNEMGILLIDWTDRRNVTVKLVEGGKGAGLWSIQPEGMFPSRPSPCLPWDGKWYTYPRLDKANGVLKTYRRELP